VAVAGGQAGAFLPAAACSTAAGQAGAVGHVPPGHRLVLALAGEQDPDRDAGFLASRWLLARMGARAPAVRSGLSRRAAGTPVSWPAPSGPQDLGAMAVRLPPPPVVGGGMDPIVWRAARCRPTPGAGFVLLSLEGAATTVNLLGQAALVLGAAALLSAAARRTPDRGGGRVG